MPSVEIQLTEKSIIPLLSKFERKQLKKQEKEVVDLQSDGINRFFHGIGTMSILNFDYLKDIIGVRLSKEIGVGVFNQDGLNITLGTSFNLRRGGNESLIFRNRKARNEVTIRLVNNSEIPEQNTSSIRIIHRATRLSDLNHQ